MSWSRWAAAATAAIAAATGSGCAAMLNPGPDRVPVYSEPPGARVSLDGEPVGTTPTVVTVPRSSEGKFRFELDGHPSFEVDRNKVANGLTFLNLLLPYLWLPGLIIDGATGHIGKYSEKPLTVRFGPGGAEVVGEGKPPPAPATEGP